jgi:hypothetical protein
MWYWQRTFSIELLVDFNKVGAANYPDLHGWGWVGWSECAKNEKLLGNASDMAQECNAAHQTCCTLLRLR